MKKTWIQSKSSHNGGARQEGGSGNPGPAGAPAPSHDEIARRAYELFMNRGCQPGLDRQDWLEAESELRGLAKPEANPSPGNGAVAVRSGFDAAAKEHPGAKPSITYSRSPVRRNSPPHSRDGREA